MSRASKLGTKLEPVNLLKYKYFEAAEMMAEKGIELSYSKNKGSLIIRNRIYRTAA